MSDKAFLLESVGKAFDATEVLRDLSLTIDRGEFVAIVGPSGCGKTTLLNLLSGFDKPTTGRIVKSGHLRMIHQQGGLFPWQTAAENIAVALRHVQDPAEKQRQIQEMLELIELGNFGDHYPYQLSGGMSQRVELARALAGDTDTLLMDEPFSSVDYLTRLRLRQEFARMLHERPRTIVLVTHDIEEAAHLADRVVVLTERPARIRCEFRLHVPRPRDLTHPEVVDAVHRILLEMGLEAGTRDSLAAS